MTKRRRAVLASSVLVAMLSSALLAEILVRSLDGYRVLSWDLERARPVSERGSERRRRLGGDYAESVRSPEADIDWYWSDPPRPFPGRPVTKEVVERADRYPGNVHMAFVSWNEASLKEVICRSGIPEHLSRAEEVHLFEMPNGEPTPRFRHLPNIRSPGGMATNALGFRGPDLEAIKPEHTVRIGFLGASTTLGLYNQPYSYPEHVIHWLNLWSASSGLGVRFEGINTGRYGLNADDYFDIARYELVPLQPDLVVFYEGHNTFEVPYVVCRGPAAPAPPEPSVVRQQLARYDRGSMLERHSAIAARARGLLSAGLAEPEKPDCEMAWPESVDELDPDLASPHLPGPFRSQLSSLERIEALLAPLNIELVLTSFVWLVEDGLRLRPGRDHFIHRHLNVGWFPYRYRDIRRAVDFENRLLRKFAASHGLPFIDVEARFPRDPKLFLDGIHLRAEGVRLQAWILLQGLIPWIEREIASGSLPKAAAPGFPPPASFEAEDRLTPLAEVAKACRRN